MGGETGNGPVLCSAKDAEILIYVEVQRDMVGRFEKGSKCHVRVNGKRFSAEVLDVRDRVVRVRCLDEGFDPGSRGVVVEFEGPKGTAAYFTRFLTSAPEAHSELVLLRSANLQCDELRSFLRVPTEITVTLTLDDSPAQFEAKLLNISSGGALLESDTVPELEENERLKLRITDDPAVTVEGELVHFSSGKPSSKPRFGVRFVNVDDESVRKLTWFVWKRVKQFFQDYS